MAVIVASITISSIFGMLSDALFKKSRAFASFAFVLAALALLLPLALRGMGVDYYSYVLTYDNISIRTPTEYWAHYDWRPEPLYALLNYVAYWVFGSFQGVNVLCAILSVVPTFWTLWQFRDKVSVGMATFALGFTYYIQFYGLNRMMIAVAFVSCAYVAYVENRTLQYFALVLIAALFHYSAFMFAPMYFVLRWMEKRAYLNASMSLRGVLGVALVFSLIVFLFPRIAGSFVWYSRYSAYFEANANLSAVNNSAPFFPVMLLAFAYSDRLSEYLERERVLVPLVQAFFALTFFCVIFPMHRLCYFFFPAGVLLYGAVPGFLTVTSKETRYAKGLTVLFALFVVAYGVAWLARPYIVGETLWLDFIDPYVLGSF